VSSSSLFSSISRADAEAAQNASTSVCLVSVPSLFRCLDVFIFLFQIFLHVINPRFHLSSSASHTFNVAVECLVWESIIFHPFHVTKRLLFWILSIIVSSCSSIFLTVSFLTFCSLKTPSTVFFWANPFLSTVCSTMTNYLRRYRIMFLSHCR